MPAASRRGCGEREVEREREAAAALLIGEEAAPTAGEGGEVREDSEEAAGRRPWWLGPDWRVETGARRSGRGRLGEMTRVWPLGGPYAGQLVTSVLAQALLRAGAAAQARH